MEAPTSLRKVPNYSFCSCRTVVGVGPGWHYTAWDPPTEINCLDGQVLHVIKVGDDMHKIAKKNGVHWMDVWNHNPWIIDPKWIYPGDVVIVPSLRGVNELR